MAGVLLQDGVSSGQNPFLKVLEICSVDAKHHPSDLLPYLPLFRPMFPNFPTDPHRIKSSVVNILLDDVEAVTLTTVKVRGPHWYIKIGKGQCHATQTL